MLLFQERFLCGTSLLNWKWQVMLAIVFAGLWGASWWAIAFWSPDSLPHGWSPPLFVGVGFVVGGVGHLLFFEEHLLAWVLGKNRVKA